MPRHLIGILIAGQFMIAGCAHKQARTPVVVNNPPPQPKHEKNVTEVQHDCNNIDLRVKCTTQTIDNYLSMLVQFEDLTEFRNYGDKVADYIGEPFCRAVHQTGLAARFFFQVLDQRKPGHMAFDCEERKWTDFVPEPKEIPKGLTFEQICKFIEDDPGEPFHCKIAYANGMTTITLTFTSTWAQSEYQFNKVSDYIGDPFCDAAARLSEGALIVVLMPKDGKGMKYNCDTRKMSPPYPYHPAPAPQPAPAPAPSQSQRSTTVL